MNLTGSEIVIACLKEQGVDTVFGYPGGTILNIYDALYSHPEIRHILTADEQGAAHAADGYARATGKVGVCFATSGPGATNLITGIATAYMDSVPLVAITCNVSVAMLGKDSFQEVDIAGITVPITKYSMICKRIDTLADNIRRAFRIARSGRPGPVLVDITKDVTAARFTYEPPAEKPERVPLTDTITEEAVYKASEMINAAKKPLLFVGGGAISSGAGEELVTLSHRAGIPVCDSLMGKGAFPGVDPLYMGMLGMHGTKAANILTKRCDLLIAAGVRFSDRDTGRTPTFASQARKLQFDVDPAEINKNVLVDLGVHGDLKEALKKVLPLVLRKTRRGWVKEAKELSAAFPLKYNHDILTGPYVIEQLYEATHGDAIITTDVGQHQMWAAQYYRYTSPRTFLSSGGLGTMGFGLGAAIGAKAARPEKCVVNISGDGCFRMNMNELMTAARYGIKVIDIVLNNRALGMVRQWQELFYNGRYAQTLFEGGPDIASLAGALGARGITVKTKEEVRPAIEKALAHEGPTVLDCQIDREDLVFPMAPGGTPIELAFDQDDIM